MPKKKKTPAQATSLEESKLFINLLRSTRQYVLGRSYSALTAKELLYKLSLPEQHEPVLRAILKTLIAEGILKLKQGRYECHTIEPSVTGIIHMHPRGFGFVTPDDAGDSEDIFIPKHLTLHAVDGDQVEVVVNTESVTGKGPEGKIVAILSRSRTHIAGIITEAPPHSDMTAYAPLLGTGQQIAVKPSAELPLRVGDRVVMAILNWGDKDNNTECTVSHHIGHISDSSCDVAAAIEEFGLQSEFSTKALKEAMDFGTQVSRKDIAERKDLRHIECFTIDPTTAKDFDDALSLTKDSQGNYHLIVHIADVSHYVREGSAIDKEAGLRCNSTYFPGYCLPMLPPSLSENLCSLKANVNRLTVSIAMDFDSSGNLLSHRIFRSVIKSCKRFTYAEAKEVLDGIKKSKYLPSLQLMVEFCQVLKVKRYERGSLEFALPDLVIKVDEKGFPTGTDYVAYDITHQMVEEFMLKANETVAQHLTSQGKNVAYRVHEEPAEENMKDFVALANSFGFNLPNTPQPRHLQELFDEALQTPYGQYLAVSYIRRMRQAQYSPENIGHYGLGLTHYCHFTSPIRRYIDLIIHRSLFDERLDLKKLNALTTQCSDQERISAKAENSVCLLKKLRLLDKQHIDNPFREYEAVVTRVKNFGFSFEVLDFLMEGFLHVSALDQDYFVFEEKRMRLCGRHTNMIYASGDRITVMLKEVDYIFLESKWSLVSERPVSSAKTQGKSKSKYHKSHRPQKNHDVKHTETIISSPDKSKETKKRIVGKIKDRTPKKPSKKAIAPKKVKVDPAPKVKTKSKPNRLSK